MDHKKDKKLAYSITQTLLGEPRAFQYIIDQYQRLAFTIALRIVKDREDAEEVVQDAFLKVYKNLEQHNRSSKFSSWLFKIVYNTALTKIRKRELDYTSLPGEVDDYGMDYGIERIDAWNSLKQQDRENFIGIAMENMKQEDALILSLYYLADKDVSEICDIMDLKKSTTKVKLHRARAKLHVELNRLLKKELKELL
ncbi:sigma-70 family RNA polymerase sigma factor [Fulvivirgaceae bacterium BMA10]|uniref:RNA polymerase sigma factor n=1 Tax=Splendidivirga corallicola TaxID=3051826 RepID=A0ABT8KSK6_9BACT|nr:sigma-70 family RNA polymerase sigma factor [Fulvivirgaceae bacterium BMA10]